MVKIELEIDEDVKEFTLPTSWEDVTVADFAKIYSNNYEEMTEIEQAVTVLSTLGDIDTDDIMMLTPDQFKMLSEYISFINQEVPTNQVESIKVGDDEYFLKNDFSKLTLGETISIELIVEQSNGNILQSFDKLLCIFLRKKKENGKLEAFKNEFMDRTEQFKTVKIMDVYHMFSNFSSGNNSL
jgi:hypothetical protein